MTIRRQWLIVLVLIAILSVSINSFVLSSLTDSYFKGYVKENYQKHFNQIVDYITDTLNSDNYSASEMAIQLETHLVDPIIRIKVYDKEGALIADVTSVESMGRGMMNGNGMMRGYMRKNYGPGLEEVDNAQILDGNQIVGQVNITKYSSAENSIDAWLFQSSLIKNSLYSIGIVLVIAVIIGLLVSKKMSKDLIQTADMAQNIDMGNDSVTLHSKVKEIRIIQQSLESLKTRLMIRQQGRKALIDEMVHQTRTPLTIIKTHLEGIEDGIIEMNPEEIKVCENQVENITSIISNISSMIDAEKFDHENHNEPFEIGHLLHQIVSGLSAQFEKKRIALTVTEHGKINLNTDKYKLNQAVYNIVTNAYKYTDIGGQVIISYETSDSGLTITIEDNGVGISREDQDKIFNAYFRGTDALQTSGEGIGLYIAQENINSIGGTLSVESELNKGSKFKITLPL